MAARALIPLLSSAKVLAKGRNPSRMASSLASGNNENSITGRRSLEAEILKLKSPTVSITGILQDWVDNGNEPTISELRRISRLLANCRRYHHSLQVLEWAGRQEGIHISASDRAERLQLMVMVKGLIEAEAYFWQIPDSVSKKFLSLPLLRGFVKERDVDGAEAFMKKLCGSGLVVSPHPYNEMMKLYMAVCQYKKVGLVIREMKRNKVPRDVLSYNLWMRSFGEKMEVGRAEMVYQEMVTDCKKVRVGWSTLATLVNIYIKAGLVDKALKALIDAEEKLTNCNRLGYMFLITQYAGLENKEGVHRLWEASKAVDGRITCANYICMLSCLVKVDDIVGAERVFWEWESSCRNYDIRVSNVLLGAYVRKGLIDKAESLHMRTLERGGRPNYKTWEILMQGWVKSHKMDKAVNAMKEGFALLKHCEWRPSTDLLMIIAEFFEKHGNFGAANDYLRLIHQLGLVTLPLYKVFLRMHLGAQRPATDILEMMKNDNIEIDEETSAIVKALYSKSCV